jgi:sigma-B regulation protein RsbU (phosphoserine phosphatase)
MDKQLMIDRLRHNILFETISDKMFDVIKDKLIERRYVLGDTILEDESEGEELFLLVEGRVKILKKTKLGEEKLLALLHPGDFFGELELVDGRPRSAKVIALDGCVTYTLKKTDFEYLLRESHTFTARLMQVLSLRLRALNNHFIKDLAQHEEQTVLELKKLEQLIEATKNVNSTLELDKVLKIILDTAMSIVDSDRGTIYLVDEERLQLSSKIYIGSERVTIRLPIGKGIAGYVAATGDTISIEDAYLDPRFNPKIDKKTGYHTRTILCMPLKNKEGIIVGVLQLINKRKGIFSHDDENFIRALSIHAAIAIENARLYESERAYKQMREEVRLAAKIQLDLLPKTIPQISGYDLAGKTIPAKVVGGDYFDFITLDKNHLGICLGDVSGKGLPASLLMANLQATLRGQSSSDCSPRDCLSRSNTLLFRSTSSDKFVTLIYGLLDPENNKFKYSNAGHDNPFLIQKNKRIKRLKKGGIVLGIMPECVFEDETVAIQPGDILVLYSDGVIDAQNIKKERFGEERLTDLLQNNRSKSAQDIIDAVVDAVNIFSHNLQQSDDITMVVVKRVV